VDQLISGHGLGRRGVIFESLTGIGEKYVYQNNSQIVSQQAGRRLLKMGRIASRSS